MKTLDLEDVDGVFDLPDAPRPAADTPAPPRFLAAFDSALLAYPAKRRTRLVPDELRDLVYLRKNLQVKPTFLVDGFVAGDLVDRGQAPRGDAHSHRVTRRRDRGGGREARPLGPPGRQGAPRPFLDQQAVADAVLPRAVAVVGAAPHAFADEPGAFEHAHRGVVDAHHLGLDAVQAVDVEQAVAELAHRASASAAALHRRVEHQRADLGDPRAAVDELPAHAAGERALGLDHQQLARVGGERGGSVSAASHARVRAISGRRASAVRASRSAGVAGRSIGAES